MSFLFQWLLIVSINTAATISPGPAFIMTTQGAIYHGRKSALFTVLGLGLGVATHILFILFGLSFIIAKSAFLYNIIKYAGATYLIFIGIKALKSRKYKKEDYSTDKKEVIKKISNIKSFYKGLLTNTLNPKAIIFFTAVYAQFLTPEALIQTKILYSITPVFIEIIWFSLVVIFLTNPAIKQYFLKVSHWVNCVCGGLMIALGLKLALYK